MSNRRADRILVTLALSLVLAGLMFSLIFLIQWTSVYAEEFVRDFGEDVKLILISSSLVQVAYGETLTYEELVILANGYRDWDYVSEQQRLYIYDAECLHHGHYQTLDDYYKYTILGICNSYTYWLYQDRDECISPYYDECDDE